MITFVYNILFGLMFWEFKSLDNKKHHYGNHKPPIYNDPGRLVQYNRTQHK